MTEPQVRELSDQDEEEFTRAVLYSRNESLYNPDDVRRAHVVGVGGIGAWVALSLAMAGVRELHLYDDDDVELHNLNRVPLTEESVGEPKVEAVAEAIQRLRPRCTVVTHNKRIETEDDMEVGGEEDERVIICVDSALANNTVLEIVEEQMPEGTVLRAAYDGDQFSVMNAGHQWDDGPGGYGADPSYVAPPMVAAGLVVERCFRAPDLEVHSKRLAQLGGDDEQNV